jgi:hypothetical protein
MEKVENKFMIITKILLQKQLCNHKSIPMIREYK